MSSATPWPTAQTYALAHRCSACGAEPGQECVGPVIALRRNRMHAVRLDRGIAHYYRDIQHAPWPEDRIPGRRYDSLGDLADPTDPACWVDGRVPS